MAFFKKNHPVLIVYFFTLTGIIVWIGLIFLAPLLRFLGSPLHAAIYAAFSPTCHQEPSRCFTLWTFPLAVCARCLGIYGGFFLGTLSFPIFGDFKNPKIPINWIFLLFSFPILLDTAGNFFHLWSTPSGFRFISGMIWGSILPFYFIPGVSEAFTRKDVVQEK